MTPLTHGASRSHPQKNISAFIRTSASHTKHTKQEERNFTSQLRLNYHNSHDFSSLLITMSDKMVATWQKFKFPHTYYRSTRVTLLIFA